MASSAQLSFAIRAVNEASRTLKDVQSDINRVNDEAEKGKGKLGGFAGALGDVGKIATGFLAANAISAGIGAVTGFVGGAVDAAKDLGESLNAVNVVFGASSTKILQWGKDNATAYGLSSRQFNQLVTPLGAMLQNYGFSAEEAGEQSITLAKRAADMASVFNVDVSEALEAIQAGLRGEADPLEKFGVGLNAAAIEAKALAMTGKDVASSLTDQEKKTASLALIMEQTDKVAGDFVNTSDSLANSQRIAAAETEEMQAQLGEKLLPVTLLVTKAKLELTKVLVDKIIPAMEKGALLFKVFWAAGMGGEGVTSDGIFGTFERLGIKFAEIVAFVETKVIPIIRDQLGQAITQLGQLLEGLYKFFSENETAMYALIAVAGLLIVALFPIPLAITAIITAGTLLLANWDEIRLAIDEQIAKYEELKETLESIPVVGPILQAAFDSFVTIVDTGLKAMFEVVKMQIDLIVGVFKSAFYLLTLDFDAFWENLKSLNANQLGHLKEIVGIGLDGVVQLFTDIPGRILTALGDAGALLFHVGFAIGNGLLNGLADIWGNHIWPFLVGLPLKILNSIPNPRDILLGVGKEIMRGLKEGLKWGWDNVVKPFLDTITDLIPFSKGPPSKDATLLFDNGTKIILSLKNGMEQAWAAQVLPWLQSLGGVIQQTTSHIPALVGGGPGAPAVPPHVIGPEPYVEGTAPSGWYSQNPGGTYLSDVRRSLWALAGFLNMPNLRMVSPENSETWRTIASILNARYMPGGTWLDFIHDYRATGASLNFSNVSLRDRLRQQGLMFQTGGIVPGTGPVPAIVHGGELIIPVEKVRKFNEMMNLTNQWMTGGASGTMKFLFQRGFKDWLKPQIDSGTDPIEVAFAKHAYGVAGLFARAATYISPITGHIMASLDKRMATGAAMWNALPDRMRSVGDAIGLKLAWATRNNPRSTDAAQANGMYSDGSINLWNMLEAGARWGGILDKGGWLPPGLSFVANNTGRHERVLGPGQSYGEMHIHLHGLNLHDPADQDKIARTMRDLILRAS